MKKYAWELVGDSGLVGTGTVKAQSQIDAYKEAWAKLDSEQRKAVTNKEIQFNIQEWIEEKHT